MSAAYPRLDDHSDRLPRHRGALLLTALAIVAATVLVVFLGGCGDATAPERATAPKDRPPDRPSLGTFGSSFQAFDMGGLPGALASRANAVNDSGFAVGGSGVDEPHMRPVLWPNWSLPVAMPMPAGAAYGEIYAINRTRDMAGYAHVNGADRAIRWRVGVQPLDLGTLGGSDAAATGINNAGTIVGWSHLANGTLLAFRWTQGGGMVALSTLNPAAPSAEARAISDSGTVVGESVNGQGWQRPVRWTPGGQIQDLGTLGGHQGSAYAIAADQSIVGFAQDAGGNAHAVRWLPNGQILDQGMLAGTTSSYALAIAIGPMTLFGKPVYVVGWSGARAFITPMSALPTLTVGPTEVLATGVMWCSDAVGWEMAANGTARAVRWTRGACP